MEHPSARSASWLGSVLEASLSGVLVFEPVPGVPGNPAEYRAIFANRAAGELIGMPSEQLAGNSLGNLFPNDGALRAHFDRVVSLGEAQRFEFDHLNPGRALPGRTWFDASASRLDDGAVVVSFVDVTATRQVQVQAEKTIGRLHSILDGSPAAIGLLEAVREAEDPGRITDFTIVSLNEQFCALMKYDAADLIGKRFRKLFKRSLTAKLYDRFVRVVQTGVPLHEELRFERGPLQGWFDLTAVRQGDGLTITVLDVTDYREAEEKAQQSARMLETVLDRAQAGVTWHHAVRNAGGEIEDFQVVAINDASAELFAKINPALRGQALEGWRLSGFFPQAWDLGLFDRFVNVVETGEPVRYERTYLTEEGELWFDVSAVKEDDGLILTFVDISRSKEAELEAEATADLLGGVFDASPWSIVFLAPEYDDDGDVADFVFQVANAKSEEIGQRPLDQLLGHRMLDLYPRTREIGLFEEYVRVLETGKPFDREVFYEGEGIARWSHLVAVRQGEGLVLTNSDITARKQAELQLRETIGMLQGVLANAPTAITWLEAERDANDRIADFRFGLFNAQTTEMLHRSGSELQARPLRELLPHVDNTGLLDDFAHVAESGQPLHRDVFYDWDNVHGWFQVQAARHGDGVVVQALDVTERKRAEERASESQQLLRDVIAAPNLGLAVFKVVRDEAGVVVDFVHEFINQRTLENLDQDMTGRLLTDHGRDGVEQLPRFVEAIETGTPNGYLRHAEFGGSERWILFSNAPIGNDRLVHRWEDVTELKETERELLRVKDELAQRATDKYLALFNAIDQGLCVLEVLFDETDQPVDYRYADVNPAFAAQTGLTDVLGRTIREIQPAFDPVWLERYGRVALTGEPFRTEAFVPTLGNWFEVNAFRTGPPEDRRVAVLFNNITERKRTEEALRASEQKYRAMFESIDEGVSILEALFDESDQAIDYRFVENNPAVVRMTGVGNSTGKTVLELFPDFDREFIRIAGEVARSGQPTRFQHFVPALDRWFDVHEARIGGEDSRTVIATFADITERKRREANQELLAAITEDLSQLSNEEAIVQHVGAKLAAHLGLTCYHYVDVNEERAEVTIRHFWHALDVPNILGIYPIAGFVSPNGLINLRAGEAEVVDDVQKDLPGETAAAAGLRAGAAAQKISAYVAVPYSSDGRWKAYFAVADSSPRRWTSLEVELIREVSNRVFLRVERARAEAALRESEARLQSIANLVPDLLWDSEPSGSTNWYNQRWTEYIGQTVEQATGWGWMDAVHPDDRDESVRRYREAVEQGTLLQQEHRIRRHDGAYRWFVVKASPLKDESGKVIKMYGAATDIHEQRVALESLRASEEKYRTLFESIDEGVSTFEIILDEVGQAVDLIFLENNKAIGRQTGLTKDVIGMRLTEIMPNVEQVWLDAYTRVVTTGIAERIEDFNAGFENRWFDVYFSRVGGDGSRIIVAVYQDITERKRAEAALRASEERQAFLLKLSDTLRPLVNTRDIKAAATAALGEWLNIASAGYAETEPDGLAAVITDEYNDGRIPSLKARYILKDFSSVTEPMKRGETIRFADLDDDGVSPDTRASFSAINVRAAVATPLIKNGAMVAYFFVADPEPRVWTTGDLEILQEVAERTWAAVERARAEEALAASEEKYRTLFESIDEGVTTIEMIFNESGEPIDYRYLNTNPSLFKQTGLTEEIIGKRATEVFPNLEREWIENFGRVALTGKSIRFQHEAADYQIWWDVYASRAGVEGSREVVLVYNNITERKREEQRQQYLLKLADALKPVADPVAIEAAVTHLALEHFGADRCYYCTVENDVAIARKDAVRGDLSSVAGVYPLHDFAIFRNAIGAGAPYAVPDVHTTDTLDEGLRQICLSLGIVSNIIVPVMKGGRAEGLFCLVQSAPREWTQTETDLVVETAERTWAAIERARAEEALRLSEGRLQRIVNVPRVGVLTFSQDGELLHANDAFLEMVGYDREGFEARHFTWRDFTPSEYMAESERILEHIRQTGRGGPYEKEYFRADGSRAWLMFVAADLGDGTIAEYAIDVSDRKRAEEALRQSEERLRLIIEGAKGFAIYTTTPDGTVDSWNAGAAAIFGWSEAEILGQAADVLFTPEDRAADAPRLELTTAATDGVAPDVRWHLRQDGSRVFINGVVQPLFDAAGQLSGFVKIGRDLTAQHEAEEALRQSEERLRLVLESAKEYAIFTLDSDRRVTGWNAGAQNLMGYAEADILGQLGDVLFTPEDRAAGAPEGETAKAARDGRAENERWHLRQDGSRFYGSGLTQPLRDEAGNPVGFVKIMRDLTEQKRAEADLREAEEAYRTELERQVAERTAELADNRDLLRSVLDATADGVVALRALRHEGAIRDFEYLLANHQAERLLNEQDLVGKHLLEALPDHQLAGLFKNYAGVVKTGRPWDTELFHQGKLVQAWMSVSVVKFGDGCVVTFNDITVRKKAEQELRRSKDLLQSVFDATPNGIGVLKPVRGKDYGLVDFEYVLTNQATREAAGGTTLLGKRYTVAHDLSESSALFQAMQEVARSGNRQRLEVRSEANGEERWYDTTVVGFEDGVVVSFADITARLRAVMSANEERRRLNEAQATGRVGSFEWRVGEAVAHWSDELYRINGLEPEPEPVPVERANRFMHVADWPAVREFERKAAETPGISELTHRIVRRDGAVRWVHQRVESLTDETGRVVRVRGTVHDVTERREAEAELQRRADRLQSLLNGVPVLVGLLEAVRDEAGRVADFVISAVNDVVANLLPETHQGGAAALQGRTMGELYGEAYPADLREGYIRVFETGEAIAREVHVPQWDRWFAVFVTRQVDGNGIVASALEITDLKRLQLESSNQAKMLAGILDNSANSLAVYRALRDEDGRIADFAVQLFNKAALESANLKWADVEGKTLLQISPRSKETGVFDAAIEVVESGVSQTLTRDYAHLGKSFNIALSHFNRDGLIVGSVDITELRKAHRHQEELLEELQKSNLNLEQFAYVTSHDLQEPLRKIQSFGQMLAKRLGERLDPADADLIHRMQDAAGRMKILIEDLLTFSRLTAKKEAYRWLHLDRLVREVLNDLESTIQEKSALVHVSSLPRLKGDAMQWRQLLQNLLSNALKFSRAGVVPEVWVEARTVHATDCPDVTGLRGSETYWEFTVADNGIGFDDQYREKIFDMFQRLHGRAEYAGTGIGLAIAKKVVEQHGGCVSAHGVPGQGATFRVYVPTTLTEAD